MIYIYTDEPERFAGMIRSAGIEIPTSPLPALDPPRSRPAQEQHRIGWLTAVLLAVVAGGAGYIAAPRQSVTRQADAAGLRDVPPQPEFLPAVPAPSAAPENAETLERELAAPPVVEPPPAAPSSKIPASGPAAFGLQQ